MKASAYWFQTQRAVSKEVVSPSHQLMIKAGLMRAIGSGLLAWLPTGTKVLNKIAQLIRKEMNRIDALEILMPIMQPAQLWEITGRIQKYGPELFQMKDRQDKALILGPTHEECICALVQHGLNAAEDFPKTLYQIQTKFRDEKRPRGGAIRAREFLMKDAYSFHLTQESLSETYEKFFSAYARIFKSLGLEIAVVAADNGQIGGAISQEFHVLCPSGEDLLAITTDGQALSAASIECLEASPESSALDLNDLALHLFATHQSHKPYVGVVTLKQHRLNKLKLQKVVPELNLETFQELNPQEQLKLLGRDYSKALFSNSIWETLPFPCYADYSARGAFERAELAAPSGWADLREAVCGDSVGSANNKIEKICTSLEVGHIFQLGDVYSRPFQLTHPENSQAFVLMGCYGIGVSRLIAALLEQHADEKGARFMPAIAPFELGICLLSGLNSPKMRQFAEQLYQAALGKEIDVLFDERNVRPGVMLTDMERIGVPYSVVLGPRLFEQGLAECRVRLPEETSVESIPLEQVSAWVEQMLARSRLSTTS